MYATLQDFKNRLGSSVNPPGRYEMITDRVNERVADDAVGQALITDADGFVNAMLAPKFRVPIDVSGEPVTANFLRKCVLDIAAYNGYAGLRKEIPKAIADAYAATMKLLQAIRDGEALLPSSGPLPGPTAKVLVPQVSGTERVLKPGSTDGLL